ncbi:cell division protein DedD [Motilimonas sp. E26]|uniref:cell division protein DedD n=1 Tax=Motilimonas sp. E26 TaxID=2865674 RepID=UPI001E5AFEF0|nr:cell division protein DedD [Motilimonas sp. E26]
MATQFQNRLVGTIILVALAVLFLPNLLDGQKESYREEFVAIPIQPEMAEPSQQQAYQPPADLSEEDTEFEIETLPDAVVIKAQDDVEPVNKPADNAQTAQTDTAEKVQTTNPTPEPIKIVTAKPVEKAVTKATPEPVKVAKVKPTPTPKVAKVEPKPTPEPLKAGVVKAVAPVAKAEFKDAAWVVQLGAFRNAANVKALVKKLQKAGYTVHTIPAVVTDQSINKVFVGPDVSAQKLEQKLPALKELTGLQGRVIAYNPLG